MTQHKLQSIGCDKKKSFVLNLTGAYSWTKSWDEFSEKIPVKCETTDELFEIALDNSVKEALG